MANQVHFDALELARRANAEIDDMRRMAHARPKQEPVAETEKAATTMMLRVFRTLAKGG